MWPKYQRKQRHKEDGLTYTRQRYAVKEKMHKTDYFLLWPLGGRFAAGHSIMKSTRSSSATWVSGKTLPLTEMPASTTVRASPDTSGCHQASPLPSEMRR